MTISLKTGKYKREAVYLAALSFAQEKYILLDKDKKGNIKILLEDKHGLNSSGRRLEKEFMKRLEEYALRNTIEDSTRAIRNKVIKNGLFSIPKNFLAQPFSTDEQPGKKYI